MLAELNSEKCEVPDWLASAAVDDNLPLAKILTRSMFYPASGIDGRPVQYFGGAVHSFVYVDQNLNRQFLIDELQYFKGYRLLFVKDVGQDELGLKSFEPHQNIIREGDRFRNGRRPYFTYANWAVFERLDEFGPEHGPERFSLLYICGEAVSAYWSLYWRRNLAPFAITLIKCDGFTGNWTSFKCDTEELATLVMTTTGWGSTKYLFGETGRQGSPRWRWFPDRITTFHSVLDYSGVHHQHLTVWRYRDVDDSKDLSDRLERGVTRAEILDDETVSRTTDFHRAGSSRFRSLRGHINAFLRRGINPLEAIYFKSRLTPGCTDASCTTCGGGFLRDYLKVMNRAEIIDELGKLNYEAPRRYEAEIRATLMYLDAGHLGGDEIARLGSRGVRQILNKMIEHHALRLEKARVVAKRERERYLQARQRRAELATERLPNAIRRLDRLAVQALIRKGANPDYVQFDGVTARIIANKKGVTDWLPPSRSTDDEGQSI